MNTLRKCSECRGYLWPFYRLSYPFYQEVICDWCWRTMYELEKKKQHIHVTVGHEKTLLDISKENVVVTIIIIQNIYSL